ncbi:MAG: hypothetical protein DRJ65_18400 [Acidobacteria bacterium]|nr:MAG: hypothetical protein DRJ65_18400 [Acidobacteriota bacterium]
MTSAAFGTGNHSVANALAAGVPLFPFSATPPFSDRLPWENGKRAAPPDWAFWALSGLCVGVGFSVS